MSKKLTIVKVTTNFSDSLLLRQTPSNDGIWENHQFRLDDDCDEADWWVVASGMPTSQTCYCDPANTIFISNEPPSIKYHRSFLQQFGHVIICDEHISHKGKLDLPYPSFWWAGAKMKIDAPHQFDHDNSLGYSEFKHFTPPFKKKSISLISSRLTSMKGHRARVAFIDSLKNRFPNDVDIFGYHENPLSDKLDGLLDYKYHICIENTVERNYWTEKINDPILAFTLPIYHGCPNISNFLPDGSYIKIDINNQEESFSTIQNILDTDPYEHHLDALNLARRQILDKYNFFSSLSRICQNSQVTKRHTTLHHNSSFPRWKNHLRQIGLKRENLQKVLTLLNKY